MAEHGSTPNHEYPLMDPGSHADVWGAILNEELIEELEVDSVVRDIASERSNYEAYENGLFIATDTGDFYVGDGVEWQEVGSLESEAVVTDGDGVDREIWVIENGANDPPGAGPDDIIFEKEA